MLNGPALLRVFLVVIAAAVLTGLVQHYWIFDNSLPERSKPVLRPTAQSTPARQEPAPARSPQTAVISQPAKAATPASPPKEAPRPQPQISPPVPMVPPEAQAAAPTPSPAPAAPEPVAIRPPPTPRPSAPPPPVPVPAQAEPAQDDSTEPTDGRAIDLVDLNGGSLAELNALKGGGTIGRAIIQHRPYTSTDQLLSKRVLSRTTYQRIKSQVTVR